MYKFTNYADYQEQREALITEAQSLLNNGDLEKSSAKAAEVTEMDKEYEQFATAQANIAALSNSAKPSTTPQQAGFGGVSTASANAVNDMYDTVEYRTAFMNYVVKGVPIPSGMTNADANTKTSDVATVIPTQTLNRIVEKMEAAAVLYNKVTKTAYKGGVSIPTSSAKPTATWVAEGATSDKQKKTTGSITFAYHKLRCAISMSLEVEVTSLSAFETLFVAQVSEAMIKTLEAAIVSGDGNGKPKGILAETAPTGQVFTVSKAKGFTYKDLCQYEAALPAEYEGGAEWHMSKKTFMEIMSIVDSNGQPIARINYGVGGKPERSILGRNVNIVDSLKSFSSSGTNGDIVAFIFRDTDYMLNTNLSMTTKKYQDDDTEDYITKAVMLVDGKVVDVNSLVTVALAA